MTVTPRLSVEGLTKRYGNTVANDGVSFSVQPGEIYGLLGENGAGKSTLMRCLCGAERPDAGQLRLDGKPVVMTNPAVARRLGIAMVFQQFSLIEALTVAENAALYLGEGTAAGCERLKATAERFGFPVATAVRVAELSPGERQRVELLRCLMLSPRLLVLDEPTAVLTPPEVDRLLGLLRTLAADGCSVLFISHKLAELKALCARATVLRRGRVTATCEPAQVSDAELARLIVGEDVPLERRFPPGRPAQPALELLSVSGHDPGGSALRDVELEVCAGEIVGLAGVAGNGQELLSSLIAGEARSTGGSVRLAGEAVDSLAPEARRRRGLQVLPPDRHGEGAVAAFSLADNLLLTQLHRFQDRFGFLKRRALGEAVANVVERFGVRAPPGATAGELSGGNLQKFLLARALCDAYPAVLLCHHPTWGVDVRAAAAIHEQLIAARDAGTAVLLITEDLDELYLLADRVGALFAGSLSRVLPKREVPRERLGQWMTGVGRTLPDEAERLSPCPSA